MYKTAEEIADIVLCKLAINMATIRNVSSNLIKKKGIRGGMGVNLETGTGGFFRNPGKMPGNLNTGPALAPNMMTPGGKSIPIFSPDLQGMAPGAIKYSPGAPILTGGRGGAFDPATKQMSRISGGVTPALPAGAGPEAKEMLNRVGIMHEGLESTALGKGMSFADRIKNWGGQVPEKMEQAGLIGGGHMNPGVILQENNIAATLPKTEAGKQVTGLLGKIRNFEGTWGQIGQAAGKNLEYGGQRFSRHAVRRLSDLIKNQGGVR